MYLGWSFVDIESTRSRINILHHPHLFWGKTNWMPVVAGCIPNKKAAKLAEIFGRVGSGCMITLTLSISDLRNLKQFVIIRFQTRLDNSNQYLAFTGGGYCSNEMDPYWKKNRQDTASWLGPHSWPQLAAASVCPLAQGSSPSMPSSTHRRCSTSHQRHGHLGFGSCWWL